MHAREPIFLTAVSQVSPNEFSSKNKFHFFQKITRTNSLNIKNAVLVPDPPTGVTVTQIGNNKVSVSFTAPINNGGSPITSYTVTASPGTIIASGSVSPIVVSGLTLGINYTFSVVATNSDGNSLPVTSNSMSMASTFYWDLNGNSGTNSSNFIGTIDNQSLKFKTNNIERINIDSNGAIDLKGNSIQGFKAIIVNKTDSYTLTAEDNGKILTFDATNTITLTVPLGLPIGFNVTLIQKGVGQIVFTAASGVELNNRGGFYSTVEKFSVASIISYASNVLVLSGDLD